MTKEHYLLYIDILGFSALVDSAPSRVAALYKIINSLNVHQHQAFKVIAFSDTVLVYNLAEPKSSHDHRYTVMFACEFAQDLAYRLAGLDLHFRAIIIRGEFQHYELQNLDCFFGKALVSAHQSERQIPAIGLFITDECNQHNEIFPTAQFSQGLNFVFLNQSLESLQSHTAGALPTDPYLVSEADEYPRILHELRILRDVFLSSRTHSDPRVRSKHLATYDLYRRRYPVLLPALEAADFVPEVICPSVDWTKRKKQFSEQIEAVSS